MSCNDHDPIADILRRLAFQRGYGPLTPEQAQAEYDAAEPEDISQEFVARIARAVVTGEKPRRPYVIPSFLPVLNGAGVEDAELAVLNRNRGEDDPEAAERLEELRRRALEEDDDVDAEDETRLED